MRIWHFSGMLLLLALAAKPCSMAQVRKLWTKKPGSESKLSRSSGTARSASSTRRGRSSSIRRLPRILRTLAIIRTDWRVLITRDTSMRLGGSSSRRIFGGRTISWTSFAQVLVDDQNQNYKHSGLVIDPQGKWSRVPSLRTREFSEGLAAYEAEGKPGIRRFEPGKFIYRDYPGLKGFVDRTGNIVIPSEFAEVGRSSMVSRARCWTATVTWRRRMAAGRAPRLLAIQATVVGRRLTQYLRARSASSIRAAR